jgi:uncharacterized protein with NRDE domain
LLALRDENSRRAFDPPDAWWPQTPTVVGGRDRQAGGTWCASDVELGRSAVVLNRPERRTAAPGAPSRGELPLLGVKWGTAWLDHIEIEAMASFNLVLVDAEQLRWWSFDGESLQSVILEPGTYLFKPRGRVTDDVDERLLTGRAQLDDPLTPTDSAWAQWLAPLRDATPNPEGTGLLVDRVLEDGGNYRTVFAQFVAIRPSALRLDYTADPATRGAWTSRTWGTWAT